MKTTLPVRHRFGHALGMLMGAMLGVWMLGAVGTPAVAAATAVPVDQQPLTLQPPIPPNIVLMLDDSGSMNWDFMPDANYLTGNFSAMDEWGYGDTYAPVDALHSASVNGSYYNPNVTYNVPVHADGTGYPVPTTLGGAYFDPFSSTSSTIDLTQYLSPWICDFNGWGTASGSCPPSLLYAFPYYTAFPTPNNTNVYAPTVTCQGSDSVDPKTGMCSGSNGLYVPTYSCNSSSSQSNQYDWSTGYCDPGSDNSDNYVYLFTYTTWDSNTNAYVRHYVGKSSSDCSVAPSGTCVYDAATQQNVATWFSYYRRRIYMAKSGLMTAFSTINPKFRIGFGSIDGDVQPTCIDSSGNPYSCSSNYLNLPSSRYTYTDTYNGGANNYIAEVAPFDTNCAANPTTCTPGQTGTQRASFWNWISQVQASGGTPLRQALDAVGRYYSDSSGQAWSTMSSDPTTSTSEIACRQSYAILTTDGFWNDSFSGPGNADGTTGATVSGPNGQSYTYSPASPYQDTYSNTLADVAMKYWETDLRLSAGIAAEVPTNPSDPAFWQHMTTFTMGLGFTPQDASGNPIDTNAVFNWADGNGPAITNFSWPQPSANSLNNIADLAHAAVDGHGGFYSATSPQTFTSGLTEALKRASERVGTGASLAANSTQLTNGTVAYQANYYTAKWKGDLKSLAINSSTGAISTTPNWTAAKMLNASATTSGGVSTYPNRNIVTYVPPTSATASGSFVPFQNASSAPPPLSAAELSALGSSAAAQMQMVNYLRGDNTLEEKNNGTFRNRDTPLGDIVDSQPVYSGAPNPNEFENESFTGITATSTTTDNSFNTWAVGTVDTNGNPVPSAAATRTPLVFVAANDGMLHAFNASTGTEVYAYLPGAVITGGGAAAGSASQLATLSNPGYGSSNLPHAYYNDGELTIADVFFNSAWHTVLVGTTGRGPAEAVYALDITYAKVDSSGNFTGITPLWERSANDGQPNSNYIGQMVGKPVIAKVQDGSLNSDWQVLIGNGYNSASGQAALLEFNVATGALSVHTTTSRITGAGNGLAAPVAWMNDPANGISTQAYAGDLQGQVWSFPLSVASTSKSGGTTTTTYTTDPSPLGGLSNTGSIVFSTPTDTNGNPQPITAGMLAGKDPTTSNVWLFFGTGQYLSSTDLSNKQVESWYGVIAQSGSGTVTSGATQSKLVQRSITYEQDGNPSASPPTLGLRTVTTTAAATPIGSNLGWYINLQAPTGTNGAAVSQGERMVTPNQFQGNLLLGTTRIPVVTDICNPSGSGWVMAINPFTGTNPSAAFFTGLSGTVTITNPNGSTSTLPAAGVGFSSLPNNPIFVGGDMLMSFDNGTTSSLLTSGSTAGISRVSWQELVNP